MSTLNVANITDGSTTVATEYVVNGSAKAWGVCDASGVAINTGTFNVSSITDNGTNGKDFALTSSFSAKPIASLGMEHIARWAHNQGILYESVSGVSVSSVGVRYYNGSSNIDSIASFLAHGDLA